jgi:hypothetical protein
MIQYNVTLSTTTEPFKTTVSIEDRGDAVQNNKAAIQTAISDAHSKLFVIERPERVERV